MGPQAPAEFDFTRPELWPEWKERYQRYHRLSKTDKESEEYQIDSLLYTMGDVSEKIMKLVAENKREKYADVIGEMDKYFQPKSNVAHSIVKFNSRQQMSTESNEAYIRELNSLSERCGFGDQKDSNMMYRLLTGMKDKELSLDLQQLPDTDLTLSTVISRMRAKEDIVTSSQKDVDMVAAELEACSVDSKPRGSGDSWNSKRVNKNADRGGFPLHKLQPRQIQDCRRCGRSHKVRQCPAYGKQCRACGLMNHFSAVCMKRRTNRAVNEATYNGYSDEEDTKDINVDAIDSVACKSVWYVDIFVLDHKVVAKVDTGAQVNILCYNDKTRQN